MVNKHAEKYWNLIFDSFLDLFKTGPVRAIGFADDGALVIKGPDPSTLASVMQQSLAKVQEWSESRNCSSVQQKLLQYFFIGKGRTLSLKSSN